MTDPVLVCGASGQVGGALRAALDAAAVPWIGLSRRPPPPSTTGQWRVADFERPSTLGPALDGVGAVFLATSDHPRQDRLEASMIEACRARGVRHVGPPRWLARAVLPFASGMPRWQSNLVVDLVAAIAAGAQSTPTRVVAELTGAEARPIERFIDAHHAAFAPQRP